MERVRRLLAIANDPAASDNEQRIALEQAQRLMDKHAIEEWQLEENHDDVEIIKEDYTVGDAVYEAYCDGRKAPVTDVEIKAAAKYLKANPGLFGPSACFIDPNRFEEIARSVLQAARNAVGKDME